MIYLKGMRLLLNHEKYHPDGRLHKGHVINGLWELTIGKDGVARAYDGHGTLYNTFKAPDIELCVEVPKEIVNRGYNDVVDWCNQHEGIPLGITKTLDKLPPTD